MATEKKDTVTKETVQKEKMVKIRLPKTKANEDDERVWVNNRSWQIQRGVEVEVPECVAEVLRHKEEMQERIMLFKEANSNN